MQALRRAGTNVLYLDYRGSWGSGGTFTFQLRSAFSTSLMPI